MVAGLWAGLLTPRATAGQPAGARERSDRAPAADGWWRVGTAAARPGETGRGVLRVPPLGDPGYDIPIVLVNGMRPGPTLALIAGLHGAEFASVVALQRLAKELSPGALAGRVVIVPLVNVAAFERLVPHVNPVDGKNVNRLFPGDSVGTQSARAVHVLTTQVLARADYVIDYHGGDLDEDQRPYAYWLQTGDARRDSVTHDLLRAFGIDWIIRYAARGLDVRTAHLLPTQALALGKPAISVDAGRAGTYTTEDLRLLVDGTYGVMARLGMIDRAVRPPARPLYFDRAVFVTSDHTGTFLPAVRRGEYVPAGGRLGVVTDAYGDTLQEVVAPESAVVLYLNATPSTTKGGSLFYLGIPAR